MSILKGHLEHFGLQELLQTLSQGARSGTLEIARGEESVSIVFETGHITLVRSDSSKQLRLRSILLREGVVSSADLEQAGRDHEETGILLGRALVDRGVLAEAELENALRKKIEEELFDLFLWTNGSFEFFPEQLKSDFDDDTHNITRVQVDPMSIIIEGLRQADEWTVIRQRIQDHRWILVPESPSNAPAENHSIYQLIDGARTIEEVMSESTLTRFDTCSVLYRFMEDGFIREATTEEMIRRARDRAAEDPMSALVIYEVLLSDHDPDSGTDLIEEAAECAGHAAPEVQAKFLRHAVESHLSAGNEGAAWKRLQRLLVLAPGNLEDLRLCWQIRNALPDRKVPLIHEDYCKALRKSGDHQQLATVLREAESIREKDGSYWLQLGEALVKTKDSGASDCLKKAIALSRNEAPEIALRAERNLRALFPDLNLDDGTLEELLKRQEELERSDLRKKYTKISSAVFLGFLIIMQFSAEWRARGMLAAAKQIETNADGISNLITAAESYERVGQLHPWTFAAGNSEIEGQRMRELIHNEVVTEKDALHRSREEARSRRQELRIRVDNTLNEADRLIDSGLPLEARLLVDRLTSEEIESLPPAVAESIPYPVVLESIPAGAKIFDENRNLLGVSPLTLTPVKGDTLEIHLEKSGCRSRVVKVTSDSAPRLFISLVRSPERTLNFSEPIVSMCLLGDMIVTTSRDGKIRLLSNDSFDVIKEISTGLEGHPAPLLLSGQESALALPLAGKPIIVMPSGKTKALGAIHPAPWTSASPTNQQGWILGDADGKVFHFDNSGSLVWTRQFSAPIEFLDHKDDGSFIVIDAMRNFTEINSAGELENRALTIPGETVSVFKNGKVLLSSGKIWTSSKTESTPIPKSTPRSSMNALYFTTDSGWVSISDHGVNECKFSIESACSPIQHSFSQEMTWVAGHDGILRLFGPNGAVLSEVDLGGTAIDLAVSKPGTLLVSLSDGRICVVKEQE